MRRAAKIDGNQQAVVMALRQVGARVLSLAALGDGAPDLAVWFRGRWIFLEVKNADGRGAKFTPAQLKWRQMFDGASTVVMDAREALEAIGAKYR